MRVAVRDLDLLLLFTLPSLVCWWADRCPLSASPRWCPSVCVCAYAFSTRFSLRSNRRALLPPLPFLPCLCVPPRLFFSSCLYVCVYMRACSGVPPPSPYLRCCFFRSLSPSLSQSFRQFDFVPLSRKGLAVARLAMGASAHLAVGAITCL